MSENVTVRGNKNPSRSSARRRNSEAKDRPNTGREVKRGASLRKLEPTATEPIASVMDRMDPEDAALLRQTLAEPMECVYDKSFPRVNAEARFLTPLSRIDEHEIVTFGGSDPLAPAASSTRSLSAEEERELFLCLNYCRYRAMRIVRDHANARLTAAAARELVSWLKAALKTRAYILRANLSLVPAMAKRSKTIGVDLGDLISEGNLALLRSVDKFDCTRGFKFSTYACRAILSSFSSSSAKASRYRATFPTEFDPALEKSDYLEQQRTEEEFDCVAGLKAVLGANLAGLSTVERQVIEARFDLNRSAEEQGPPRVMTLKQVAELIGVTKERVRQIQNKALDKLRLAIEDEVLAA